MPKETGLTPLSLAASSGHDEVVKIMLGREDFNLDWQETWFGLTPLS